MQLSASRPTPVVVNGEPAATTAATLAELLSELGYPVGQVATALNGEFVSRQARAETRLAAGDKIEIVAPRQGG
jgi:sulfur carrier protein